MIKYLLVWYRYIVNRPHVWTYCEQCGPTVMCGYCRNICCTGVRGDGCPDRCVSAHAMMKHND
jgi:hypothetical protein